MTRKAGCPAPRVACLSSLHKTESRHLQGPNRSYFQTPAAEPSNRPARRLWLTQRPHGARTGRGSRARTCDLRFWRPPLYQLSYTPIARCYFTKRAGTQVRFGTTRHHHRRASAPAPRGDREPGAQQAIEDAHEVGFGARIGDRAADLAGDDAEVGDQRLRAARISEASLQPRACRTQSASFCRRRFGPRSRVRRTGETRGSPRSQVGLVARTRRRPKGPKDDQSGPAE